jgi:signal transduction histidine kinase/ligand-binding sensor domain-containing protein
LVVLKSWYLWVVLFLLVQQAWGQVYHHGKLLTTEQGLSDNRVTCFYEDKKGFIWIGTRNGLNRYDGYRFEVFRPTGGNAISNEVINDIAGDEAGNVWVATMNGLNRYVPSTGKWTVWKPGKDGKGLPNNLVWDIDIEGDGTVWIASDVRSFSRLDAAANRFTYYDWPAYVRTIRGRLAPSGYHAIQRLVRDGSRGFWLGTNKGLFYLDRRTGQFSFAGGGYNADVLAMERAGPTTDLVVALQNGQLFTYAPHAGHWRQEQLQAFPYPSAWWPVGQQQSDAWVPHIKGVVRWSQVQAGFGIQTHQTGLDYSLPAGGTTCIMDDKAGNRWVGTGQGVYLLSNGYKQTSFLPLLPASESASIMGNVYYDTASGCYWVPAIGAATVFVVSRMDGSIRQIRKDAAGRRFSGCYAVRGAGGSIWLMTHDRVYTYQPAVGQFVAEITPFDNQGAAFRDVVVDKSGTVWLASFQKGILYRARGSAQWKKLDGARAAYLNDVATALAYDTSRQLIWMASFGRYLHAHQLQAGKTIGFDDSVNPAYAPLNLTYDVRVDNAGRVWAATHAGGVLMGTYGRNGDWQFRVLNMSAGLRRNQYQSILPVDGQTVYMLSGSGISVVRNPDSPLVEMDVLPLPSTDAHGADPAFPQQLYHSTVTNEILLGVHGGLLVHQTGQAGEIRSFPIEVPGLTATDHEGRSIWFRTGDNIRIDPVYRSLQLPFASLYFGNDQLRHEYRLEGYDHSWLPAGAGRTVQYQQLKPGLYHFQVRALDAWGKIVSQSLPVSFTILPSFWQTWWFRSFALVLALLLVFIGVHHLRGRIYVEGMVNRFATSLYGKNSVDAIFQDIARNLERWLGDTGCRLFAYDQNRERMMRVKPGGFPLVPTGVDSADEWRLPASLASQWVHSINGNRLSKGSTRSEPGDKWGQTGCIPAGGFVVAANGQLMGFVEPGDAVSFLYRLQHRQLVARIASLCAARIAQFLGEERLRAQIARDLHDEMGSTLTSINILSTVAMASDQDTPKMASYLQKIKDHSANMMESMSDIVWAINPANDRMEQVLVHMKEWTAEMLEPAGINYYFDADSSLEKVSLSLAQRKDLFLIYKEAIHNVVKYSKATEVLVQLTVNNAMLNMRVTDNGIGFNLHRPSTGNGMGNMASRAAAIGATLFIDAQPGKGTAIHLHKVLT